MTYYYRTSLTSNLTSRIINGRGSIDRGEATGGFTLEVVIEPLLVVRGIKQVLRKV